MPLSPFSVLLALLASTGGFIFGYDTGQISNILLMPDFLLRFAVCTGTSDPATQCAFYPAIEGLIVALLSVGTAIGALGGAPVADGLGRRKAMSVECAVFAAGVIIQVTAFSAWYQLAIGRFVSGVGVGALSAAVPMYQAETAPSEVRGTLTGTYQLFITFGILVAYLVSLGTRALNDSASWRIVIALGIIWALILGVGILFMPESPRWLIQRGRMEEALASIRRTHGDTPEVEADFEEMRQAVQAEQHTGSVSWSECFSRRNKTLYRTLLGMSLQSLQQLTGANYFFYYGATIMRAVGMQDSFITQIIFGAINFGCTFLGLYVMERFGRRWPLIIGGAWQSAWLFVFAAAGTAASPDLTAHPTLGKLMIVSACLFILGYASTWAPGVWILIGETFPTRTRAKQGALSTASNWIWNFLLAFFTPFVTGAIGYKFGFVFASCNLLGALLVAAALYESGGLSLEKVDRMYNDRQVKAWTSGRRARILEKQEGEGLGQEKGKGRMSAESGDSRESTLVERVERV
ncbi:general substrate transporter [Dacryopinax primogenitus]|uniref:General substrate transporter n=1 Tax=Dacryopinax primogenitus (strain DJM 731) TaxID=1858805 RepID=M5FR60_DACPD|nr:general substrate transporter [Dacryopinax primogenitus]EJT97364.1 general substrate transporter [Dacryopinax primogenitus]